MAHTWTLTGKPKCTGAGVNRAKPLKKKIHVNTFLVISIITILTACKLPSLEISHHIHASLPLPHRFHFHLYLCYLYLRLNFCFNFRNYLLKSRLIRSNLNFPFLLDETDSDFLPKSLNRLKPDIALNKIHSLSTKLHCCFTAKNGPTYLPLLFPGLTKCLN
jgi:hypothetical protein